MSEAEIKEIYDAKGNLIIRCWYKDGKLHRENGPAWIEYDENGKVIEERWYQMGRLHREDGPAIIKYFLNEKVKNEVWYKDDLLHREDGPAWIEYDIDGGIIEKSYYVRGTKLSEKLFIKYRGINDIIKEHQKERRISL